MTFVRAQQREVENRETRVKGKKREEERGQRDMGEKEQRDHKRKIAKEGK